MQCWRCGAALNDLLMPLARAETCPSCDADLHVCRMCIYFDRSVANQCREPVADPVKEKERSNFCGYLSLNPNAYQANDTAAQERAQAQLAELFGDSDSTTTPAANPADAADQARRQFDDLFKK